MEDEAKLLVHDGTAFIDAVSSALATVPPVGVNTSADTTNRLAVASPAALFTHAGASRRLSIDKAASGETERDLRQRLFGTRRDRPCRQRRPFVKVSSDGSSFTEALVVDAATGGVEFPGNLFADGAIANLMGDGGRFSGSPEPAGVTAGAFAVPDWVALANGATLTDHGKFVRDSATYGGAGAALDPDIEALMTLLVDAAFRRNYPEFHVGRLTGGSGTGSEHDFPDAVTRYSQLYTKGLPRPVRLTTSYYVKAVSGDVGIPGYSTRRLFVDGTQCYAYTVVPADGAWHHVLTLEGEDFARHYRYSYDAIRLYQRPGDIALIAFPAAVPGQLRLPANVGQVPGTGGW